MYTAAPYVCTGSGRNDRGFSYFSTLRASFTLYRLAGPKVVFMRTELIKYIYPLSPVGAQGDHFLPIVHPHLNHF
jgi:hypothetical protein